MRKLSRTALIPLAVVCVILLLAGGLLSSISGTQYAYSTFLAQLNAGHVSSVVINTKNNQLTVTPKSGDGSSYATGYPDNTEQQLVTELQAHKVAIGVKDKSSSVFGSLLGDLLPIIIILGLWFFLLSSMQGGAGRQVMSFGRSRAKRMSPDAPKISFRDVAGVDEAVEELDEIKQFLAQPHKFLALGARIPKGVLLYGPPGTGKTLLARAVAGEADVPFFSISGSDFVEMFVGVGAARVRDTFEQAKQHTPCIIFIDEIDAVGRHRGAGMGGGHDEREQTLNQLLVELDGFEAKDNVILIAATNRPDVLDPALLRPGRFDRQIAVDRPDRQGRLQILNVHARGKPFAADANLDALAAQTPGFTGADLANLINESALLAARGGAKEIAQQHLDEGIMRVITGPEKKTRLMREKERRLTAIHEMGHALVAHYSEHTDPIHKISIIPRGQALGYVVSLPTDDKFTASRGELEDSMAMALGGRTAEEVIIGEVTSGAANDLEKVTETAKRMVMRFGMSERLGPRVFGHEHGQPFLGREFQSEPDYSPEIAYQIDEEIAALVHSAHERAAAIITAHRAELERLAEVLLRRETLESKEFAALLAGQSEDEVFVDRPLVLRPSVEVAKKARRLPPIIARPGFAGSAEMQADA
jgi:cell division protease FtsH